VWITLEVISMAVARSDDGPSPVARRRTLRKPADMSSGPPAGTATMPAPTAPAGGAGAAGATRLDDLYRLPMPKLFAYAEREGLVEHTGMNRGQLIMTIVRHQVERGVVVRGSGTLEVPPHGYGFLRPVAHNVRAS